MKPADEDILKILTHRVRVLSVEQLSEIYGAAGQKGQLAARRRVARLERDGWIIPGFGLAQPELSLAAPVFTWRLQSPAPNFEAVSYQLRKRWTLPPRPTHYAAASAKAGTFFGGSGGRLPRTSELTHDICLARVFLRLRAADPKRAERWVSEARLFEEGEGRGDRLPDALIVTRREKIVVEFGGSYTAKKLKSFHDFCVAKTWGYEVW